jgi:acyl-CoA thioesterase FadM
MTVLKLHAEPLRDDWLDAYGHLNEAYYLVPFSNASWALQDHFGIGVDYFERTGGAIYTVETHLLYLKEVRAPAMLEVETMVLDSDILRATFECVALHFDTKAGRTAAMPEAVQAALKEAEIAEPPDWAGRGISLGKR